MANLSTTYMGFNLKNPIIAASSGLTDSVESLKRLEEAGAAAVVLKSLFEEEILLEMEQNLKKMQTESFLYPETVDFYEHDEHDDEATMKYLELIANAKKHLKIPVIASINCVTASKWTSFPKRIQEAGADGIELNIFVLPSDFTRTPEENEQVYFDIIEEVKKQVTIPIGVKMSPYFSSLGQMLQKVSQTGIKGLTLFNRFYNPDIDTEYFEITSANVLTSPGNISRPLRWTAIMANRVQCSLAGSGGVHSGEGLVKMLLAGADAVQVASILYKNGPSYISTMLHELEDWMKKHDFASIDEFKGRMSQSQTANPAAYERVQFMRYFRGYKKNDI